MTAPTESDNETAVQTRPLWKRLLNSLAGLQYVYKTQRNARVHLPIAVVGVCAGVWLRLPPYEWMIIALTIGLLLASEVFNSAIEAVVDLASPDLHPLAKAAKDAAAGAVLLLIIAAIVVALLIYGPPLYDRLA